ncbi:MAG: tRNA (adenosine(37)-N6)-threonylcarbamoyltransferase complex ATPase subunit type 1 TsaE [Rubrivivax sp.]
MTHPQILETRRWHWPDEDACASRATELARRAAIGDAYVELQGPLGAGKTTFVRHLLRALGVKGRIKSPTYAVLEPYQVGELCISHFDFYRFEDARELIDAGFRDVFAAPGLKLAEWPEHAAALLPTADVTLSIGVREDGSRTVQVEAATVRGLELLG